MKSLYLLIGSLLVAACGWSHSVAPPYSFCEEPFIHPRIVRELTTWWSDNGDQVISVNLPDCQKSNRYCGRFDIDKTAEAYPEVTFCNEEAESSMQTPSFSYQYIGQTKSGIHVLKIIDCGGGSLVLQYFLLLSFEKDLGIEWDETSHAVRDKEQIILKRIGEISGFMKRNMEGVTSAALSGNTLYVKTSDSFDPLFEGSYAFQIP